MIVGKVLGSGNIERKISISALGFSEQAREKLKKAGCTIKTLKQEIENNKKSIGLKPEVFFKPQIWKNRPKGRGIKPNLSNKELKGVEVLR